MARHFATIQIATCASVVSISDETLHCRCSAHRNACNQFVDQNLAPPVMA
jgi:hypothetical protein